MPELPPANPFVFQMPVPPDRFIDRDELLRQMLSNLLGGNHLALYGSLKTGKSSILAMLEQRLRARGKVVLFAAREMVPTSDPFQFAVDFWNAVLRRLSRSIGLQDEGGIEITERAMELLDKELAPIYLLIDDFELLVKYAAGMEPAGWLFESMRVVFTHVEKLSVLIASRESGRDLARQIETAGSPLLNIFIPFNLDDEEYLPTPDSLKELLAKYLSKVPPQLQFTENEIARVVEISESNFARLQYAANLIFDEKLRVYDEST